MASFQVILVVLFVMSEMRSYCGDCAQIARQTTLEAAQICTCGGLSCQCCFSLDAGRTVTACLQAVYIPEDLTLDLDFLINGRSVYQTQIGPGAFPICPPITPPFCLAFNRIHFDGDQAQFCAEIRIGPVPVYKIPCLTTANGNLIASPNRYR